MFYDIFVTAAAVALTLTVWFTIGFMLTKAGVVKGLSKFTITNPPAWLCVILCVVLTLTVLWPCALYIIVANALESYDINIH